MKIFKLMAIGAFAGMIMVGCGQQADRGQPGQQPGTGQTEQPGTGTWGDGEAMPRDTLHQQPGTGAPGTQPPGQPGTGDAPQGGAGTGTGAGGGAAQ